MPITAPLQVITPFANNGTKNVIPIEESPIQGNASFVTGFPEINSLPIESGGIPPTWQDFNGLFYTLFQAIQWQQAGGNYPFSQYLLSGDGTTIGIGGYPLGAVVQKSDGSGLWVNILNNNNLSPEVSTNGVVNPGWLSFNTNNVANINVSSSNITLTTLQASAAIIVFMGSLTSNINITFPNRSGTFIVSNQTTGNFVINLKTSSSSGVSLPKDSNQLMFCDGNNIKYTNNITQNNYAIDTGANNTYVATYEPPVTSLYDGLLLRIRATHSNTGSVTINANSVSATLYTQNGDLLIGGEILPGTLMTIQYSNSIPNNPSLSGFILSENAGSGLQHFGGVLLKYNPSYPQSALPSFMLGAGMQCRFIYEGENVAKLIPYNGNVISIKGIPRILPIGGLQYLINDSWSVRYIYLNWDDNLNEFIFENSTIPPVLSSDSNYQGIYINETTGAIFIGKVRGMSSVPGQKVLSWFNQLPMVSSIQGTYTGSLAGINVPTKLNPSSLYLMTFGGLSFGSSTKIYYDVEIKSQTNQSSNSMSFSPGYSLTQFFGRNAVVPLPASNVINTTSNNIFSFYFQDYFPSVENVDVSLYGIRRGPTGVEAPLEIYYFLQTEVFS